MAKGRELRKDRVGGLVRLVILLIVIIATLITLYGQQKRLDALRAEKRQLNAQLDELTLQEEKRKRMIDYAQTDEFAEQYARDKVGLVKEDDIKFVNPTPVPEAKQTQEPQASSEPQASNEPQASSGPQTSSEPQATPDSQ